MQRCSSLAFFDGEARPHSAAELEERRSNRKAAAKSAIELHFGDNASYVEVKSASQRAAFVTLALRTAFIELLQESGVECIGAPCEADGQMSWAFRHEQVDAVMTADGDFCAGCLAILNGCDYDGSKGVLNVGLETAYSVLLAAGGTGAARKDASS
eukprot:6213014-Pleurochrysis_carterae.AAC.2